MLNQKGLTEKRNYPRTKKVVKFKISREDSTIVAETIDLSCIGAYCRTNKHIPFMTKVKIIFPLSHGKNKKTVKNVEFYGVVVRTDKVSSKPDKNDMYKIAIFFNEIEKSVKEKIAAFIDKHNSHS